MSLTSWATWRWRPASWRGARKSFEESYLLRHRPAAANPTSAEAQRDLSVSLDRLGTWRRRRATWRAAPELRGEPGDPGWPRRRQPDLRGGPARRVREPETSRATRAGGGRRTWRARARSFRRRVTRLLGAWRWPTPRRRRPAARRVREPGQVATPGRRPATWRARAESFEESLQIARRLAAANPTPAAALTRRVGEPGEAGRGAGGPRPTWRARARASRKSYQLRHRLAAANPTSAAAQRDVSVSLNKWRGAGGGRRLGGRAPELRGEPSDPAWPGGGQP